MTCALVIDAGLKDHTGGVCRDRVAQDLQTHAAAWPEQCRVLSMKTGSPLTSALHLRFGPNEALLIVKGSPPMPPPRRG